MAILHIPRYSIVFIASLFANVNLSWSSPLENDPAAQLVCNCIQMSWLILINKRKYIFVFKFQQTMASQVEDLQAQMKQVLSSLEMEKNLRNNLQVLNEELSFKINQLAMENQKQEEKIERLMIQSESQENEIRLLKSTEPKSQIKNVVENENKLINSDSKSPRVPPSSCRQLSTIGHYLDGIYLVANPDTKKIETVYCDFGGTRKD